MLLGFKTIFVLVIFPIISMAQVLDKYYFINTKEACEPIYGKSFRRLCWGQYSKKISFMYHDTWTGIGDSYAVFQQVGGQVYFVSFNTNPLMQCKTFKIQALFKYTCNTVTSEMEHIENNNTFVVCTQGRLKLTEDLLDNCGVKGAEASILSAYHYFPQGKRGFNGASLMQWSQSLQICMSIFILLIYVSFI